MMMLKRKRRDHHALSAVGQVFFLLGILPPLLAGEGSVEEALAGLMASETLHNTICGLLDGLSVPFLFVSIVLQLPGALLRRHQAV
jgi:hypothetical protein